MNVRINSHHQNRVISGYQKKLRITSLHYIREKNGCLFTISYKVPSDFFMLGEYNLYNTSLIFFESFLKLKNGRPMELFWKTHGVW